MSQKKDKSKLLFFRNSSFKVAKLIFDFPNKVFHIRKLAKETGLSTTATTSAVEELNKYDIVKVVKTDLTTNIQANLESSAYIFYKKVFNLYRLERYNIIDLIKTALKAETIVLFGSFAKGEDIEESDIDILVITNHKGNVSKFLNECEKGLNRRINLHILPSIQNSSAEFKNAAANGIVLHGYLKVI